MQAAMPWLARVGTPVGAVLEQPPSSAPRSRPGRGERGTVEHPVLVPTSAGPLGAIVTEPKSEPLAHLVFLHGAGDARAGVNGHWARTMRALAEVGIRTLRTDWAGEGESHMALAEDRRDRAKPIFELVRWFHERCAGERLIVVGSCYGARPAIRVAATASGVIGLGLVVPPLRARSRGVGLVLDELGGRSRPGARLNADLARELRVPLAQMPVWLLTGELDGGEASALARQLGDEAANLELAVVEGLQLHGFRTPAVQDAARAHIVEWASRLVTAAAGARVGVLAEPR